MSERVANRWQARDIIGRYIEEYEPTIHTCPPDGGSLMPCCDLSPFERIRDRLTLDPTEVTCKEAAP